MCLNAGAFPLNGNLKLNYFDTSSDCFSAGVRFILIAILNVYIHSQAAIICSQKF